MIATIVKALKSRRLSLHSDQPNGMPSWTSLPQNHHLVDGRQPDCILFSSVTGNIFNIVHALLYRLIPDLITSSPGVKFTLTNVIDLTERFIAEPRIKFLVQSTLLQTVETKSLKMSVALGCTIVAPVIIRTSKPTISNFEKFPREIREMIYELCLCVDGILTPYPDCSMADYRPKVKERTPEAALLALNKQIRDEAIPILFGKNIWRITANEVYLTENDASSLENGEVDTLWHRYGSHMQKVDLGYTRTPYPPEHLRCTINHAHEEFPNDRSARTGIIHDQAKVYLESSWVAVAEALSCCPNIRSLNIDIGDLYCLVGCCRTNIVRSLFDPMFLGTVKAGVEVSVSGIFNEEERGYVVAWRTRSGSREDRAEAIAHTQIFKKLFDN